MNLYNDPRLPHQFWARVEVAASGCWLWTGSAIPGGYGRITHDGKEWCAHRLMHVAVVGAIPAGYEVDHLCRITGCVNPCHLEAVTPAENRRRKYAAVTECRNGHLYDAANTYIRPNGQRDCRTCIAARVRAYKRRRRSAA